MLYSIMIANSVTSQSSSVTAIPYSLNGLVKMNGSVPTDLPRMGLDLKGQWLWERPSQSTRHCKH